MYIARFSYDVLPADREAAMEFIRRELDDARERAIPARILVPFTRGPDSAALQFEIEVRSLDELDQFRHEDRGSSLPDKGEWMRGFSAILRAPPIVEILRVHG